MAMRTTTEILNITTASDTAGEDGSAWLEDGGWLVIVGFFLVVSGCFKCSVEKLKEVGECSIDACKRAGELCFRRVCDCDAWERRWGSVTTEFSQCIERNCQTLETGNVEAPPSVTTPTVSLSQLSLQTEEGSTNSRRDDEISTAVVPPPPSYDSIISDPSLPPPSYEEVMRWRHVQLTSYQFISNITSFQN